MLVAIWICLLCVPVARTLLCFFMLCDNVAAIRKRLERDDKVRIEGNVVTNFQGEKHET